MAMARPFQRSLLRLISVQPHHFCTDAIVADNHNSKKKSPPSSSLLSSLRQRLAKEEPNLNDFLSSRKDVAMEDEEDVYSVEVGSKKNPIPKPHWMKRVIPGGEKYTAIKAKLRDLNLHTVCEEAKCPNIGECWTGGDTGTATATIMILGDTCTRGCR